ncbi:MAG: DUF349 domain-containing protein [Nocardioidaceae bacterium]
MSSLSEWGRVDADGSVFVRTRAGERQVGQWPGGDPEEALALYARRFDGLRVEVELLAKRLAAGALSPEQARSSIARVRRSIESARAVGDLEGLLGRLDSLAPQVQAAGEQRKAAKVDQQRKARTDKERIATAAERVATGNDWRSGGDRLRTLLAEWKELPRLDPGADEELWHRFSSARTTYTRRRTSHFAELGEQRESAKTVKQRLAKQAEALSGSTDWAATARAFRDLMTQWKAAGPAPRVDEDQLWRRFRAAQDAFFGARDALTAAQDQEYAANAVVKRDILAEAERLLPVADPVAARAAFRKLAQRWDAAGKVPRDDLRDLEARFRRVEEAVASAESERWARSNPEARARAVDTVAKLEASLVRLVTQRESATARGDVRAVREAETAIEARQAWLVEARKAVTDFTP